MALRRATLAAANDRGFETREAGDQTGRKAGLEQEFFLVDAEGRPSDRADEFLRSCREASGDDSCYAPEFVKGMVEVSTPPVSTMAGLAGEYLEKLGSALDAARALGLRLYPLGTYPLPLKPAMREGEPDYDIQVRTVGPERFVHAGRCAGTHLHLELPPGTVDTESGLAPGVPTAARSEALNLYNLATALDPALVALTRSCPFYEGRASGMAERTVRYRGSEAFGWEGVYVGLPQVGALLPYAGDSDALVEQQFRRHEAWLEAMEEAGLERRLFSEAGGDLLRPAWNPVRLNRQGTVELRSMDSNLPGVTLTAAALVLAATDRVRQGGLTVTPDAGVRAFEVDGERLLVPDFAYLGGDLLQGAVTGGADDPDVAFYLDSVFGFAGAGDGRLPRPRRGPDGGYSTTEAEIRKRYAAAVARGRVSEEEGLRLVRGACDELEAQASHLRRESGEGAAVVGAT